MTPIEKLLKAAETMARRERLHAVNAGKFADVLQSIVDEARAFLFLATDEDETLFRQLAASVEDNARKKERAAIVAYLRASDSPWWEAAADHVESGDHIQSAPTLQVVK